MSASISLILHTGINQCLMMPV